MVSAFPSMKMLSFLAMVRVVFCAWAIARLDTLDVKAIVVATMIADLYLDPVIWSSCGVWSLFPHVGWQLFWPSSILIRLAKVF